MNEMLRLSLNDSELLGIKNFSFRPLFRKLSLVNIMRVVIAILHERQIILFSSNLCI